MVSPRGSSAFLTSFWVEESSAEQMKTDYFSRQIFKATHRAFQVDALRKALSSSERANEGLQEDNRQSAEKFREMADKVYALMDALRLNQVRRTPIMV